MGIFIIRGVWISFLTREYFLKLCLREFILTYENLRNVKKSLPLIGTNMVGARGNNGGWSDIMEKVDMLRIQVWGRGDTVPEKDFSTFLPEN